jgi:hypothetical protein
VSLPSFEELYFGEDRVEAPVNITLENDGWRTIDPDTVCHNCDLLQEHQTYPRWYKCIDSATNIRGEWAAYFVDGQPMACARKE